jgi:hypothetical protein
VDASSTPSRFVRIARLLVAAAIAATFPAGILLVVRGLAGPTCDEIFHGQSPLRTKVAAVLPGQTEESVRAIVGAPSHVSRASAAGFQPVGGEVWTYEEPGNACSEGACWHDVVFNSTGHVDHVILDSCLMYHRAAAQ